MIKIMHTGDQHFGVKYSNYEPTVAEELQEARFLALQNTIERANKEACDFYVVCGDLFENTRVPVKLQERVLRILGGFDGTVLIIPGNHDYCEPDGTFWPGLEKHIAPNTILLTELSPRTFTVNDQEVVFYPCGCPSRTSKDNMLAWVKECNIDPQSINIGIAHGAIETLSLDAERKYFLMTFEELTEIPVDLWLIGHTHIPYPSTDGLANQKVLNAGTHQQLDRATNTPGNVFLLTIDDQKTVSYKAVNPGVKQFVNCTVQVDRNDSLTQKLQEALSNYDAPNTVLYLSVNGIASEDDYDHRGQICKEATSHFFYFPKEVDFSGLRKEITESDVLRETMDGTIERDLLESYLGDMELLNLAFNLVKECKGEA